MIGKRYFGMRAEGLNRRRQLAGRPPVVGVQKTEDAAAAGFDDDFIYQEIEIKPENRQIPMVSLMREESLKAFELWKEKGDKMLY